METRLTSVLLSNIAHAVARFRGTGPCQYYGWYTSGALAPTCHRPCWPIWWSRSDVGSCANIAQHDDVGHGARAESPEQI